MKRQRAWFLLISIFLVIAVFFIVYEKLGVVYSDINEQELTSKEEGTIQVVATTTMITDLVKEIGGDHVEVEGLIGPGIDPHGYQASPTDVIKLMNADMVISNGLHLEGKLGKVIDSLEKQEKASVVLGNGLTAEDILKSADQSFSQDPHIWFSVKNWKKAAGYLTEELIKVDPENKEVYQNNYEAYRQELDNLDLYIKARTDEVDIKSRYLITAHDAFKYFGEEYDFRVVGLQGLNPQSEAGTGDISDLAQFIVENRIKAIFVESSVPVKTIESLQDAVEEKGWTVNIGGELYSDALGDAAHDADTYIKMYQSNIDTIVDALK